jgi:hypothetical protein
MIQLNRIEVKSICQCVIYDVTVNYLGQVHLTQTQHFPRH